MNLKDLTPEQKIRLLAELDGITGLHVCKCGCGHWVSQASTVPNYLTSYDAIIPLVQKLHDKIQLEMVHYLGNNGIRFAYQMLQVKPSQLCDAVLVATGKAEL